MRKALLVFLPVILCASALAPAAQADPAEYVGSSSDGSKVFFSTTEKLVPGDTDNGFRDVYERFYDSAPGVETYVTREISTGPTGGSDAYDVSFDGVSGNGSKVFFSTYESLVAEDKDHSADVYMRNTSTGATTLVSQGASFCAPGCGNGSNPATYVGSTPDGSKVFFTTSESLGEGDAGETRDVYVRDMSAAPASTALVSRPDSTCSGCGSEAPVQFQGASADGTKVVFESIDKLAEGDGDSGEGDIYERDLTAGKTALVSVTGTCPAPLTASECGPLYRGLSSDGTRVFFQTRAQIVGADEDKVQDVYEWSSSAGTTLLSTSGEAEEGKGTFDAVFEGASPDGSKVIFETQEKLSSADGDGEPDLYERSGSTTTLVSSGTAKPVVFNRVSTDGSTVLFSTVEALGVGDSGEKLDVYLWSGGTPTLVSAGSPTYASNFAGASRDATKVFYTTVAQLSAAADKDDKPDIYEGPGTPTLISTGPVGGNGSFIPHLVAVSEGGDHAFFTTEERLTVDDNFAAEQDVYDRFAGGTLLVSVANSGELALGPLAPGLTGTNPASPGASTEPAILGEAEPGSAIKLYATPDCSGAPVGIGSAAGIGGTFSIPVEVGPGSITTFHATASNGTGDTSGCSATSVTYRQENASPPPGEEGSGGTGGGGEAGGSGGTGVSTGGSAGPTGGSGGGSEGSSGGIRIGGIVYVTPITRITFGPAAKTRVRRPVFRFLDATEQPGTSFVCEVDRRAWKGCGSPFKLPKLMPGRHAFAVKGKSVAGQWEQQPVKRKFTVVR